MSGFRQICYSELFQMSATTFLFLILACLAITTADETSPSPLFRRPGQYVYSYEARSDAGFSVPGGARTRFALAGVLLVRVPAKGLPLTVQLKDLKHATLAGEQHPQGDESLSYAALPPEASALSEPFQMSLRSDGTAHPALLLGGPEPLWAVNMKRALATTLQMHSREMPGAFKVAEPCLHGMCVVEYTSSDEKNVRKSSNIPTLVPTASHRLWVSVMTNVCTKDIKNPLVGNSEKWYTLDDEGMTKLTSFGSIEIHYHKHILKSSVNLTLERVEFTESPPAATTRKFPLEVSFAFQPPPSEDPTGARSNTPPPQRLEELYTVLAKAALGLEQHGPRDTLLKDKLPLEIHRIMSMMNYDTLKAAHDELDLGTSYNRETMRNIFLQALPQCTSPASALLASHLVQNGRAGEAALQMLRKLPFSVQELGASFLEQMEPLLKLGQEHPEPVRHAAILAYSTLVFRTFISGSCSEDTFEEYVQMFFSRFTESPDYADRLTWLMGLSNLQLQQVRTYLAPIISGGLGNSPHERFLACWATMPLAHLYPQEVHDLYWPILQNPSESLEMRIAATTMLLMAEPSPHRLLSLYWFISAQSSGHLKHFFYTTIKSMEHTTFDCYKHLAKLATYVGRLVVNPGPRFWASGNYLMDAADPQRDMGSMLHLFSVADPNTGLPNVFYFTFMAHNAGLMVQDYAVYIKLQGVAGSFLNKVRRLNGDALRLDRLVSALRDVRASTRVPALVHVELLIKHQGKTIMALHVNQTSFDKWTSGDITKVVNSFLQAESHVNQQTLVYPTLLTSILPSDLGVPVQTDVILASLTSMRGNLTHAMAGDEIARKNDINFRTSSLALISLAAYNPVANSWHTAELAQVMDLYLPANFTIALNIPFKTLRTSWVQPSGILGPGMTAYSAARVIYKPEKGNKHELALRTGNKPYKETGNGYTFICEGTTKPPQLLWQILNSHQSNAATLPWTKVLLVALHGLALAAVPAEGSCSLVLSPSSNEEAPVRTDQELELLPAEPNKLHFRTGLIRRRESEDGVVLSRMNATCLLELGENQARAAAKYVGLDKPGAAEYKICVDLEAKRGPLEVRAGVAYGVGTVPCPSDSEMNLSLTEQESAFRLSIAAKNVLPRISKMSASVNSLLEPLHTLAGGDSSAGLEAGTLISRVLARAGRGKSNGTTSLPRDQGNTDRLLRVMAAAGAWLMGPTNEMRLLAQLGVIRECRLTRTSLVDLRGEDQRISGSANCTLLLLGDCTRTPHFALFMLPSKGLKLRLYTGGNYADIESIGEDLLTVAVNGESIDWKPEYQYPDGEQFYDFKMTESENNTLYVVSRLGALSLRVWHQQAVLQLPATQLDRGCGRCMDPSQTFKKC